VDIELRLIPVI